MLSQHVCLNFKMLLWILPFSFSNNYTLMRVSLYISSFAMLLLHELTDRGWCLVYWSKLYVADICSSSLSKLLLTIATVFSCIKVSKGVWMQYFIWMSLLSALIVFISFTYASCKKWLCLFSFAGLRFISNEALLTAEFPMLPNQFMNFVKDRCKELHGILQKK